MLWLLKMKVRAKQQLLLPLPLAVIILLQFVPLFGSQTEDIPNYRAPRSPQLFPGRNVVPDLTQIKPITLNDLAEFRQKIASLANLTALLEHAVAAERQARGALQGLVNTIKEKVTGLNTAVDPDPENYWSESKDTCGGLLVSQTGKISYRKDYYYKNNERCVWVVRANYRSKIKVTLTSGNLEEHHDYIAVTEVFRSRRNNETDWDSKRMVPGQSVMFNGPLIFITFVSDGSVTKNGFQLDFEGLGSNSDIKTVYQHFHLTERSGQFDSANLSESSLEQGSVQWDKVSTIVTTISINPSYENVSKLIVSVPDNLDLRPTECDKTELTIFKDFAGVKATGKSSRCCGRKCENSNIVAHDGLATAVLLRSSATSEGSQFQITWTSDIENTTVNSVNTCGGILRGIAGTISYKVRTQYGNNERCLWLLYQENTDLAEFKVQLLKDGFEYQYDYVTLGFQNDSASVLQTIPLYKSDIPVRIRSRIVFVQFYSDSATFGKATGFELLWEIKYIDAQSSTQIVAEYHTEETGNILLTCSPGVTSSNIHAILPHLLDANPLLLEVSGGLTTTEHLPQHVLIYTSKMGNFSDFNYAESGSSLQSEDGVFVVVYNCESELPNGENLPIKVDWKKGEKVEPENKSNAVFAKSDDECGTVLYGDAGRITYKVGKEYSLNERCTWVIRSKSRSIITVQLMTDGFESCCDGLQVNIVNTETGSLDTNGTLINRERRFQTFETSVLFVMFYSDHSIKGTGFVLEFQTKGNELLAGEAAEIEHFHVPIKLRPNSTEPLGPVLVNSSSNSLTIDTYQIEPMKAEEPSSSKLFVKIEGMKFDECNQDAVMLYNMPTITQYSVLKRYPNEPLCVAGSVRVRDSSLAMNSVEETFDQVMGSVIVVTKIKDDDSHKRVSLTFENYI